MAAVMARTRMFPTAVAPVGCTNRGAPACAVGRLTQHYRLWARLTLFFRGCDLVAHHECGWILRVDPENRPVPHAGIGAGVGQADMNTGWCSALAGMVAKANSRLLRCIVSGMP